MRWKNTKIKFSKGLAFYSEKESVHFSKEAEEGWQLAHISFFGFYVFKKFPVEKSTWVIDFYDGKKQNICDYVDLYEQAGWQLVTSYRNRYFVFKTLEDIIFNYTDKETYKERIKKETNWMMFQSLLVAIPSLLLFLFLSFQQIVKLSEGVRGFLSGVLLVGTIFPLLMFIILLYFKLIYRKRLDFFDNPKVIDRSQKFSRDLIILMILGGLIGFISSYLYYHFLN